MLDLSEIAQLVSIAGAALGVTAVPVIKAFDRVGEKLERLSTAVAVTNAEAAGLRRDVEINRESLAHLQSKFQDLE